FSAPPASYLELSFLQSAHPLPHPPSFPTRRSSDLELGHFSLGRAYLEAGIYDSAATSFERVIEINPNMSRAYQLLATALLRQNNKDAAVARLTQGVKIAHERGDMMARNDMVRMLQESGAVVPELKTAEADRPAG